MTLVMIGKILFRIKCVQSIDNFLKLIIVGSHIANTLFPMRLEKQIYDTQNTDSKVRTK